ncbi:MAG: tetratricopeptide repeat protein [Bacteroidota bacterium]
MRKTIISILLSCMAVSLFGQTKVSSKELFEDGEYFFWRQDYEEAVYYYLQLHERYPENANINYKIGESYLNIPGKETLAIPYFEKAVTNITSKKEYDQKDFSEKKAPLHAYFYLGNAYRINNELAKALQSYDTFVNHPDYEGNYNLTVVENEIRASERAKIIQDSPVSIQLINLGHPVNTAEENMYPVVSADEQAMVFITGLQFYDAIFYTVRNENGSWEEPVNISPLVGSDGDLYPTYLSPDGTTLLMVKKQDNNDDIFISTLKDDEWTKAVSIGDNINSRRDESYGSLSADGKTLIFTSTKRSIGEADIFIAKKQGDGTWSKPENIGKTINTEFDEAAPYLASDGKTLFFSSQGHYNMGGYDIFYTNRDASGKWSEPINLGYPLNNTGDNKYFYPLENGRIGYMALMRNNGYGQHDIYRVEILSALTHVYSNQRLKRLAEPQYHPLKKSFTLNIVNELTKDTIAILTYDKRAASFSFMDYNDKYRFDFE